MGQLGKRPRLGTGQGFAPPTHPKEEKELPLLLPRGLQQPRTTDGVASLNKNVWSFSPGGQKPEVEVRAAEPL